MVEPHGSDPIADYLAELHEEELLPNAGLHGKPMELPESPEAESWIRGWGIHPELISYVKENIQGRVLVDLASGSQPEFMMEFAKSNGAIAYVGIDKFAKFDSLGRNNDADGFPFALINSDAEKYLATLTPRIFSICLNAFDVSVMPNRAAHRKLADEITRVTEKGSMLFGVTSTAFEFLSLSKQWREIKPANMPREDEFQYANCFERL